MSKKTAVITGAGSGFGLETARLAAQRGMNLVLVDVQADALEKAAGEFTGVEVLSRVVDVAKADQMQALADAVQARFGAPHFVFNNAGVGSGGLIWENALADWEWVLGVNLMGVVHGVRLFTPMMLAAAKADPAYSGHIVNTASMAGMLNPPNMGVYNVSKHAVVSLSETLYQDLSLVTDQVHASVLCPFFVPTGISQSHRNRPGEFAAAKPTKSQLISQAQTDKAVSSAGVRRDRPQQVLHLQPPAGPGRRADTPGRRDAATQPQRPFRRPPRDRRGPARQAAGRLSPPRRDPDIASASPAGRATPPAQLMTPDRCQ
jgi:NAD(P)-dependent dehydrogenase (short-subunit alcohol dehydrogenase family)